MTLKNNTQGITFNHDVGIAIYMSIRKVKMATAILILLNAAKRGHSSDMICLRSPRTCVSTRIRKMPVWEIFRKLALILGNVRTYPKVCVGKRLEYR